MKKYIFLSVLISTITFAQNAKETISVYFDSNETTLKLSEQEKLITFFSNENLTVESLEIEGYCDDIGTFEDNLRLSSDRATSLAKLIKEVFKLDAVNTLGKGELPLNSAISAEESRQNNRKAIIIVTISNKTNPALENLKLTENFFSNYKSFENNLVAGDKIILNNILFKGSLTIFEDAERANLELDKITSYLSKNPTISIEIQGHVCCITASFKDAYDHFSGKNNLSETRAELIYNLLIEKGISANRMTHHGYGRQFPIAGAVESFNKRVEILITKI